MGSHLKDSEAGWLAGITDGEGCIHLDGNNKGFRLVFRIGMACETTIRQVRQLFGTGIISIQAARKDHHRDAWLWTASGKDAAFAIKLIEHLLVTKKKQAAVALEFIEKCYCGPGRGKCLTEDQWQLASNLYLQMKDLNKRGRSVIHG